MSLLEYPKEPCMCKKRDFWYRGKEWICMHCHPPAAGSKEELLARAYMANRKLYLAWFQATGLSPEQKEEHPEIMQQYLAGCEKARDIARQMKERQMEECIYIEDGKKLKKCNVHPPLTEKPGWGGFHCHCCPNDYWWEKELMGIDKKEYPEVYQ